MKKLFVTSLTAVIVVALLVVAFAQGRHGPGGKEEQKAREEVKKDVEKAAFEAAKKALKEGKSEAQAKAAARKSAYKVLDKKLEEFAKKMKPPRRPPQPPSPDEMKKQAREEMSPFIDTATRKAIRIHRVTKWKTVEPKDELVEGTEQKDINEKIKGTTFFEDFKNIQKLKLTRPVIVFVFEEAEDGKKASKAANSCEELVEDVLSDEKFTKAASKFIKFRLDISKLNKALKKKYRISSAPIVIFFDCTGKELYRLTTLVKKMKELVAASEKAKREAKKSKNEEKDNADR